MIRRNHLVIVITLVFALAGVQSSESRDGYNIAMNEGFHHGGEVGFEDGEEILGIVNTSDGFSFQKGIARMTKVKDDIVDVYEEDKTGEVFSAEGIGSALVYIRSPKPLKNPSSAKVDYSACQIPVLDSSSYSLPALSHQPSDSESDRAKLKKVEDEVLKRQPTTGGCTIRLGQKEYSFKYKIVRVELNGLTPHFEVKASIVRGEKSQDLPADEILWAGDLDGDGELDILLHERIHHYNSSGTYYLMMSSPQDPNQMMNSVATFESTGC